MSWLTDPTQRILSGALDGLALREQALAANLANVDTPGYRAASTDFESELAAAMDGAAGGTIALNPPTDGPSAALAMRRTQDGHLPGTVTGAASASQGLAALGIDTQPAGRQMRVDGNGVDVDADMTALAESQLKYAAVSRMLTGKLGMLRDVVGGR